MDEPNENTDKQQTLPSKFTLKRPLFKAPAFVPPSKKQAATTGNATISKLFPAAARPLHSAPKTTLPSSSSSSTTDTNTASYYFSVLYTKYQPSKKLRKNKTFNDGILEIKAPTNKATLYEPEGKVVSTSVLRGYTPSTLGNGSEIVMGGWEVEVDAALPADRFASGEAFLKSHTSTTTTTTTTTTMCDVIHSSDAGGGVPPHSNSNNNGGGIIILGGLKKSNAVARPNLLSSSSLHAGNNRAGNNTAAALTTAFKRPTAPGAHPPPPPPPPPLHDPHSPNALVLNAAQWREGEREGGGGRRVAAVVLDPLLARSMRQHQREGLQFLYDCTTGVGNPGHSGAILADAMGLGKTLTTLALLWTLLKQGPTGRPTVNKAIVVTPSSLTRNWAAEVKKWLGDERLRAMVIAPGSGGAEQVLAFKHGSVARVAIVSYETVRQHAATLAGCAGILVADEGHRLKSAQGNKTISALLALNCPRRVILSGTPFQNDLSEFFAMADFVCTDILGSLSTFNRIFATPIARSRDRDASEEDKTLGGTRSAELSRRVESFVLRRGSEVNACYLPPLSLYVIFCPPSDAQLRVLTQVLGSTNVRALLSGGGGAAAFGDQTLSVLTQLRKICNHPVLFETLQADEKEEEEEEGGTTTAVVGAAPGTSTTSSGEQKKCCPSLSGKMAALASLLHHIIVKESGRCVVVSQSTAMLDLISHFCVAQSYSTVRIDGSTDVSKRQDIVNSFNCHNVGQIFLLSTTAGGAGLNLTGANRLILVDSHWNPALDQQAMARVWRDGQQLACTVYRLITTGTLEEKIYQRQCAKGDIASITVATERTAAAGGGGASSVKGGGGKKSTAAAAKKGGQFSKEELKQLFSVRTDTRCDTADVLGPQVFADCSKECADGPLAAAVAAGLVSYVHLEQQQNGKSANDSKAAAIVEVEENPEEECLSDKEENEDDDGSGDGASQLEIDF